MKEISVEKVKNSRGEVGEIRHYVIENTSEASALPDTAPVMSDAICKTGEVYIKFESGWALL